MPSPSEDASSSHDLQPLSTRALLPFTPAPLHALYQHRDAQRVTRHTSKRTPQRRPSQSPRTRWETLLLEPPRHSDGGFRTVRIGGFSTIICSKRQLAQLMTHQCLAAREKSDQPILVYSSNGQGISLAGKSPEFAAAMNQADIIHADGMSVVHASRALTATPLPERIATTDFFLDAAQEAIRAGLRFYFLGGDEEQNRKAVEAALRHYPKLHIVGRRNGYFKTADEDDVCRDIVKRKTDVLWLGMGKPKQELWALNNRDRLRGVGWVKTCGGLFGFLAGDERRAPAWMQAAGLEWFHRLLQAPDRLAERYVATNLHAMQRLILHTGADAPQRAPNSLLH